MGVCQGILLNGNRPRWWCCYTVPLIIWFRQSEHEVIARNLTPLKTRRAAEKGKREENEQKKRLLIADDLM